MSLLNNSIKPFEGLNEIKLYTSLKDIEDYLNKDDAKYTIEVWQTEEETRPNPWTVLFVEDCINLYFASNDKLFKIYCTNGFTGSLPNGINFDTFLKDAKSIDTSLKYNDEGEDYESEQGYWADDDLDTDKILSITVYIKEVLDDDIFDSLNW